MKTIITYNTPFNLENWNQLCYKEGNAVQQVLYDKLNALYSYIPVYIELYKDDKLIAGVKYYYYESNKLKFITKPLSKRINILGECVFSSQDNILELKNLLEKEIVRIVEKQGIVELTISGYYGNEDKLLQLPKQKNFKAHVFNTANIDLTLTQETLWDNLHSKHRNVIRKAEKEGVEFVESADFEIFKKLLQETYAAQGQDNYNTKFTETLFNIYATEGLTKMYFAKYKEEYLSSALLFFYGKTVYYAFGGNKQNSLGAGNFLQWKIFLELKNAGFEVYCLGQVAKETDEANQKFTVGISQFKTRFGTYQLPSFKHIYQIHPTRNKLFNLLAGFNK